MLIGDRPAEAAGEDGFTILELVIVTLIMAIVLSIAGTALSSMAQGSNRDSTLITEEQGASLSLNNISQDIRSAHTISAAVTGSPSSTEVVLLINKPNATVDNVHICRTSSSNPDYTPVPYQLVEWLYQSSTATMTRMVLNCGASGNPSLGTTWQLGPSSPSQGVSLSIANASTRIFTYYNQYGSNISTALPGAVASCTTRIGVDLKVTSNIKGASPVEVSQQDALTDQLNILSQPGNGQC